MRRDDAFVPQRDVALVGDAREFIGRVRVRHLLIEFGRHQHRDDLVFAHAVALIHRDRFQVAGDFGVNRSLDVTAQSGRNLHGATTLAMPDRSDQHSRALRNLVIELRALLFQQHAARAHEAHGDHQQQRHGDNPSGVKHAARSLERVILWISFHL